jgi:hypothetical protein
MANPKPRTDHLIPYRFQPGCSGPPPGYKKRRQRLGSLLADVLDARELLGQKVPGGMTVGQALAETIVAKAIKFGDLAAFKEIAARTDGPPDPERDEVSQLSDEELIARITARSKAAKDAAASTGSSTGRVRHV